LNISNWIHLTRDDGTGLENIGSGTVTLQKSTAHQCAQELLMLN